MSSIKITRTSAHCEESWHSFYQEVTDRRREVAEAVPFSYMLNAFVTFACIGKFEGQFAALSKPREIFIAPSLDTKTHVPVLAALAYDHLVDNGTDPDEAIRIATTSDGFMPVVEGLAQGGAQYYKSQVERSGLPATEWLADYVGRAVSKYL